MPSQSTVSPGPPLELDTTVAVTVVVVVSAVVVVVLGPDVVEVTASVVIVEDVDGPLVVSPDVVTVWLGLLEDDCWLPAPPEPLSDEVPKTSSTSALHAAERRPMPTIASEERRAMRAPSRSATESAALSWLGRELFHDTLLFR
jgi:hypothetical protein